jgi:hypothetical protein
MDPTRDQSQPGTTGTGPATPDVLADIHDQELLGGFL